MVRQQPSRSGSEEACSRPQQYVSIVHLALIFKLLLSGPAGHIGIAVGAGVLPQLVHKEAVEKMALGPQPCLAPVCIPHLQKTA